MQIELLGYTYHVTLSDKFYQAILPNIISSGKMNGKTVELIVTFLACQECGLGLNLINILALPVLVALGCFEELKCPSHWIQGSIEVVLRIKQINMQSRLYIYTHTFLIYKTEI